MSDENTNETEAREAEEKSAAGLAFGIAAVTVFAATVAFVVVRVLTAPKPASADPTAARIQALMDEANRLLKELDAKKLG